VATFLLFTTLNAVTAGEKAELEKIRELINQEGGIDKLSGSIGEQ